MVQSLAELLVAWAIVYAINVVPAFMPPTWTILVFFVVHQGLPLLPLAIGGAVAASAGRLTLALASRRWGRRLLDPRRRANLTQLGSWLDSRGRWAAPLAVLLYSFGPIPSNQLFIGAGLTGMRLWPIAGAFFLGRLVSYTLWTATAGVIAARLDHVFVGHWRHTGAVVVQVVAFALLFAFTRVDWPRLLHLPVAGPPDSGDGQTATDHARQMSRNAATASSRRL